MWLTDGTAEGINMMSTELREAVWLDAGLAIKWKECSYANCSHAVEPVMDTSVQLW